MASPALRSNTMKVDDEEKALKTLLDAFGSVFSLKDIASAFCKAGRNTELAGELLYCMQEKDSTSKNYTDGETDSKTYSESCNSNGYCEPSSANGGASIRSSKLKWIPVSMGSVSSFIGNKNAVTSGVSKVARPLKSAMHGSVNHSVKNSPPEPDVSQRNEFEDFLYEMLQHGFQVDRDVIRDILGQCGYDMQKSLEKLLDLTAENHYSKGEQNEGKLSNSGITSYKCRTQSVNDANSNGARSAKFNDIEMSRQQKERHEQQKEVLCTLFTVPERNHPVGGVRRSVVSRNKVVEPLKDTDEESDIERISIPQSDKEDEEDEYFVLRQAVKEYRSTMNEYYKAAAEAFAKGDRAQSITLLEKGQFFYKKARDADEESAKKIFSTSGMDEEAQDAMSVNLQNLTAKEAIRLVKCQLRTLTGIASFKYLRIINGANEEDTSKASRSRLVIKLLERESIKWTEDADSGTILIRLDEINPKSLSFAQINK